MNANPAALPPEFRKLSEGAAQAVPFVIVVSAASLNADEPGVSLHRSCATLAFGTHS